MPTLRLALLVLFFTTATRTWAVIAPLAITGDTIPGLPGAQYSGFGYAQLNAAGQGVYTATLESGPGGISTNNDKVLVSFDDGLTLNAQTGSSNVPGATDANYETFQEFKIDNSGDVLLKAMLVENGNVTHENKRGFWRFVGGGGTLITRTGTSAVAGVPNAVYFEIGARVGTAHSGDFAFHGQLANGNGVNSANDFGIWHFQELNGTLIARENNSAPDVVSGLFSTFGQPATNAAQRIAFRATMKTGGSITMSNRLGVWVYDNGIGQLIARAGSAEVPGSTSDFTAFDDPKVNEAGHVVFRGTLATGQQGLWRYSGGVGENLAITHNVGIPGVPGASFASISLPLVTDLGQAVALGTLTIGDGEVATNNDTGLWLFGEGSESWLLAREGVGGVGGINGASFNSFERIAPIDDAGIYVNATLQAALGIVDSSNDEGIWRIPFEGSPELLIRKGDMLAGRTIADLWLPAGDFDETPLTGISNASGELLFHASFTNGDAGLFLYSPSTVTEFAEADFNHDGNVNDSDLATWQSAYGVNGAGDTNSDGDTDGADFLAWQRQYTGSGTLAEATAVPEPSVSLLLIVAVFAAQARTR